MFRIILLIFISFSIVACGSWSETTRVLRNEKKSSTDEFLVKKRKPLVMPPDYQKIPEPGKESTQSEDENNQIKQILKSQDKIRIRKNKSSSIEESIIDKIRK